MYMTNWVEFLPAPVRHFAAAFIGVFVAVIATAITTANGIIGLAWNDVLIDAVNKGSVAAVAVLVTLTVTPLTNAYGVAKVEPVDPVAVAVEDVGDLDDIYPDEVLVDGEEVLS